MAPRKKQKIKKVVNIYTKKRTPKQKHNKGISFAATGPLNRLGPSGLRYHEGYVWDKLRYTVLTHTQMSRADKELVTGTIKTITTAAQAMTLPNIPGWACIRLDMHGRVFVLAYHGMEVCLFFKRQLTEIKLEAGDRFPEGVLQEPEDSWQRLDLMGQSAKKANFVLTTSLKQLEDENKQLNTRIKVLEELNDKLETTVEQKEEARAAIAKRLPKKRKRRAA